MLRNSAYCKTTGIPKLNCYVNRGYVYMIFESVKEFYCF